MIRKWLGVVIALILTLTCPVQADDDSGWDSYVQGIGQAVYFAAFPTATYRGVTLKTIRQGTTGTDLVFVVYGISAFDDDSLWTEVIVTVADSKVVNLRWGANNAILAKPGSTMNAVGKLLADLNKESQANQSASSTVRMTWVLPNQCGYSEGLQVRFFDTTKDFVWPDEGKIFLLARGETREISIDTYRGDQVCIGAEPYVSSPSTYWGVGISHEYGCEACCYTADNIRVSWPLSCP